MRRTEPSETLIADRKRADNPGVCAHEGWGEPCSFLWLCGRRHRHRERERERGREGERESHELYRPSWHNLTVTAVAVKFVAEGEL